MMITHETLLDLAIIGAKVELAKRQ
jgi:hypothetical protein